MAKKRQPWKQLKGESDSDYVLFLIYRNLGPSRSLNKALMKYRQGFANGVSTPQVTKSNPLKKQSRKHNWRYRATCWDVMTMSYAGARITGLHTQTVVNVAVKCLKASKTTGPDDDGFPALLAGMKQVQAFVTPEIVQGIHDHFSREAEAEEPAPTGAQALDGVE